MTSKKIKKQEQPSPPEEMVEVVKKTAEQVKEVEEQPSPPEEDVGTLSKMKKLLAKQTAKEVIKQKEIYSVMNKMTVVRN